MACVFYYKTIDFIPYHNLLVVFFMNYVWTVPIYRQSPSFMDLQKGRDAEHLVAPRTGAHGLRVQVGSFQKDYLCQVSD